MKKRIALLLSILMLFALVPVTFAEPDAVPTANLDINEVNFPDANFRAWVKANLAGGKTYMTPTEVAGVTEIDCYDENIASLKGIGKFPNLEYLDCSDNKIKSLDLSGNKKLIRLDVENNGMTSLNVSSCVNLEQLNCWKNELTSINVSANTKLGMLDVGKNNLSSINVSKNKALEILYVEENNLTKINVTMLPKLDSLDVSYNQIGTLDISKNPLLVDLYADGNDLTAIDVTKAPELEHLFISQNQLTSIDVTKNPKLTMLNIGSNYGIKKLDVTKNTDLRRLETDDTNLSELDLSKNPMLYTLNVCANSLAKLDLSNNPKISFLYAYDNFLTELDVSNLTNLYELNVSRNFLEELDVSNNTILERLSCCDNQIRYINLNNNTDLRELDCTGNRMEFLTLRYNTALESLYCGYNNLRQLHLENNTKLKAANMDLSPQRTADDLQYTTSGGYYYYNMSNLFESDSELSYVKAYNSSYSYNSSTGQMRLPGNNSKIDYLFNTGKGDMEVEVYRYYSSDFNITLDSWGGLYYKGTTPYMVWNGAKRNAPFTVREVGTDKEIEPYFYDYHYEENVAAGTGYLFVRMWGNSEVKRVWYKIYLPPTTATTVANTSDGIKISWAAVPGAAGYVVYRRAMNLSMSDWSKFDRWNNTTDTTWTDTKVYAGTRYQYGVKAYFKQRTDAVTGKTIGGVFDNYNLGEVGPLRTTVRIKTNKLSSVTAGTGKLTAKWTKIDVCTGYQVQIATNSSFTTGKQEVKVTSPSTLSKTISGLTSGKTYYVRVRGYNEFNGTTYYGEWTNVLTCKVK